MIAKVVRLRAIFACGVLLVALGGVAFRLVHLQVLKHTSFARVADSMVRSLRCERVKRGSIFDVNGVLLAASLETPQSPCELALNWRELRSLQKGKYAVPTLLEVGTLLRLPPGDVRDDLLRALKAEEEGKKLHWLPILYRRPGTSSRTVRIPGSLTPFLLAYRLLYGRIRGRAWERAVMIELQPGRYYVFRRNRPPGCPYRNLCREILGTVDAFGDGQVGAEGAFDVLLRGDPGWVEERVGPTADHLRYRLRNGIGVAAIQPRHIYLTVDVRLQQIVMDALRREIPRLGAERGTCLILDPRTGALRAFATFPPQRSPEALFSVCEPGSIFKCFVAAEALLERKVSVPGPVLWAGGARRVIPGRRKPVEDAHPGVNLTFESGFIRSSNIVFSIVAEKLGSSGMRRLLRRFALTDVPRIVRRMWPVKAPERFCPWQLKPGPIHRQDVISMGWGNAVMVTPLAVARAYAALVNGGYLVEPHLLAAVRAPGHAFRPVATPPARRIISNRKVLATMKDLLRRVVEDKHGTAYRLRVPGLSFGGKTGTAKRFRSDLGGYSHRRYYTGGFIAHVPAGDPRYVIMAKVEVDRTRLTEPHLYYGSWTAGPVVRRILHALWQPHLP